MIALVRLLRALPSFVADRFAAWLRRLAIAPHRPVEVEPGKVWCLRDRVPWPCDVVVRLTETAER